MCTPAIVHQFVSNSSRCHNVSPKPAVTMSKIVALAVVCSLLLAIQAASFQEYNVTNVFVGNLTEYLRTHAHNKTLVPLERVESRVRITYELGRRISGKSVTVKQTQNVPRFQQAN